MQQYIEDPETQANAVEFVDHVVCDNVPTQFADTCKQVSSGWLVSLARPSSLAAVMMGCVSTSTEAPFSFHPCTPASVPGLPSHPKHPCAQEIPLLVNAAISSLESVVTSDQLCGILGVCHEQNLGASLGISVPEGVGNGPLDCPVCKTVMMLLLQKLQDPASREQIRHNCIDACTSMTKDAQEKCVVDVTMLFSAVDDLLVNVDSDKVCGVLQFCDTSPPAR